MILYRLYTVWGSTTPKLSIFSKHNLFITIYLLPAKKLIHNNNSMQETILSNFVQANEYDVLMYAEF
jgi:hypothetical protein